MNINSMDFTTGGCQGGVMMYSAFCEQAGREVLLGPDNFVDLLDGPLGPELHYRCHCGRLDVIYPKARRSGRTRGAAAR